MEIISINNQYASGLQRLGAFIIDRLLLSTIASLFVWHWWWSPYSFDSNWLHLSFKFWGYNIFRETAIIIYYAIMESSSYHATLGKIVFGLKVVDKNNNPVDFSKALLRNLSKILSGLVLGIGYVMIIFDERKQGLHDKIADTFVVRQ
ncbi:MAG TPA: RDD family protein [Chitinophagales bacterium]|nr:RDD family protein [Chitinophagales bacterium]